MKALVRRPSPRLGEGIVTHVERRDVDAALALEQWERYVAALAAAGWEPVEVEPADDWPDAVFVEDALVMHGGVAIATRPGAESRRAEVGSVAAAAEALGYAVCRIEPPGTLDGGDVLAVGDTLHVGVGGRTNLHGATQLASLTGAGVVTVPVHGVLHLKTAVTALPDGSLVRANVLPLDHEQVMVSSAAAAALVAERGFEPVSVDIGELEKLEAGVTCLSVGLR